MIRFQPDTLRDAIWRPVAMAAPDAGVYLEIMAPDLRFAVLLLLTVATLVLAVRRRTLPCTAWLLLAFVWLAFVPWLLTSGNGRYFLPILLLGGPACVILIYHLPVTMPFRLTMAAGLLALQAMLLATVDPRQAWSLADWVDNHFEMELTQEDRAAPAAYVIAAPISYSLMTPLFHHDSHWINVASMSGDLERSADDRRAQAALSRAKRTGLPMKLIVPTAPLYMTRDRQPTQKMRDELNRLVGPHRLALRPGDCRVVVSATMASAALRDEVQPHPELWPLLGFWICDVEYPVPWRTHEAPPEDTARADPVLDKLESACPRLFRRGESKTVRIGDRLERSYGSSDIKAYVTDSGQVWFKYWRAMNSNYVGTIDSVLADGFTLDCNNVRGRSGLPWERQL